MSKELATTPTSTTAPTKATPLNEAVAKVASTVSHGSAPTNAQLTGVLGEAQTLLEEKKHEAPLTPTGQKIASQMQDVLANTATLIRDKNPNDTLQHLAADASAASKDASLSASAQEAKALGAKVTQRAADATTSASGAVAGEAQSLAGQTKAAASAAVDAAMDAAREIVSSAEFRQLVIDFINILQQGLRSTADTLSTTADDMTGKLEETKARVASGEPAESIAKEAKDKATEKGKEVKGEVKQKTDETLTAARDKAVELGERARIEANELLAGRKDVFELLPLSDQQRTEMRERFDAVLKRIGSVESYRRAFNAIFTLAQQYRRIISDALPQAQAIAETAQGELAENVHIRRVWGEAKLLIERWTNGRPIDVFLQRAHEVYDSVATDADLNQWWVDLQCYARWAIDHPDEAVTEERRNKFNELVDRGRRLYKEKVAYNKALRGMLHEGRILLDAMRNDRTVSRLTESLRSLAKTLFLDTRGNPAVKPEELRQFKILVTSLLMEEFKYIPLSRYSGSTPDYDFALSNMSVYGFDLLPEHILFKAETRGDLNTKDVTAATRSNFRFALTNMHLAMKNVMFWFRKKHGLIRMEDAGIADIAIAGRGATLTIEFEYDSSSDRSMLMRGVRCDIDKLNVHVVDSRYDWLLNMVEPFVASNIKHQIEKAVAARVAEALDSVFLNLVASIPSVPAPLKGLGDRIAQEVKDVQRTKNALEVTPSPKS
jgi:hypothetical protein